LILLLFLKVTEFVKQGDEFQTAVEAAETRQDCRGGGCS
jgi:hypothetical protein